LPLAHGAVDAAWLSTVIHHVADLRRCATELRRTLRVGAPALIRNSFGDRLDGIHWLDYFPAARAVAARRWPTIDATVEAFRAGGFELERRTTVP
jgi:hypothetical protein